MKTVKALIEEFVYNHIEQFVTLIADNGEDAEFEGIKILDDNVKFVHGMLVDATAALFVHYKCINDERAEETFERLRGFLLLAMEKPCETWGKLSVLRALTRLKKADSLNRLGDSLISILKDKTEYTDFFNKEEVCTTGYATNYMQVALACAGYRENLGWDTDNFSEKIKNKLMDNVSVYSSGGWMDEQPPYGRFDRYSFLVFSELSDNFEQIGKDLPEPLKINLQKIAQTVLFMSNKNGDGINYGRSLSCHGDSAVLEILSSALAHRLLDEEEKDKAVIYCICILEKVLNFWYDGKRKSFNIWWDGRNTNAYRGIQRVLEVNLDMALHLLAVLQNFEKANLADYLPKCEMESHKRWKAREVCFNEEAGRVAKTIILRKDETMVMLPLIGLGNLYKHQAYMPYPAICMRVEGAPEGNLPFLVPEYTLLDGRIVRPIQYYDSIKIVTGNDKVSVFATGKLCVMKERFPSSCEEKFRSVFSFKGNSMKVGFSVNCAYKSCRMLVGNQSDCDCIRAKGFDTYEILELDDFREFNTPHGAMTRARVYYAENKRQLGYKIKLGNVGRKQFLKVAISNFLGITKGENDG